MYKQTINHALYPSLHRRFNIRQSQNPSSRFRQSQWTTRLILSDHRLNYFTSTPRNSHHGGLSTSAATVTLECPYTSRTMKSSDPAQQFRSDWVTSPLEPKKSTPEPSEVSIGFFFLSFLFFFVFCFVFWGVHHLVFVWFFGVCSSIIQIDGYLAVCLIPSSLSISARHASGKSSSIHSDTGAQIDA